MHKSLFLPLSLSLLLSLAFSPQMEAQKFFDIIALGDTLTNQTTKAYNTSPVLIDVPYYYSIHVAADSISGANAGTAKLQVCNDRTGTNWYTVQTLVIDGPGTDEALWEGLLYARRVRVYFEEPAGTRKVRARVYGSFKRIY